MTTKINAKGIYIKYFPFFSNFYKWEEIKSISVTTSPFLNFIGFGIRFKGGATAYTVRGNKVIKLELYNNNNKLFIGTQNPEEIKKFISKKNWDINILQS